MRLIDADKLLEDYTQTFVVEHGIVSAEMFQGVVNQSPTVEAIPKAEVRKLLRDNADKVSDSILDIVRKDYIHKADYKNRLKADMVAMLEELKKEIIELPFPQREPEYMQGYSYCQLNNLDVIQDKINELKGDQDE